MVSPLSLINSSNFSSQCSGYSTPAADPGQSSLTPTNTGEIVHLGTPAATDSEDLIRPRTPAIDQPGLDTFSTASAEQTSTSQTRPTTPAPDNDNQPGTSSSSAEPSATAPRAKANRP